MQQVVQLSETKVLTEKTTVQSETGFYPTAVIILQDRASQMCFLVKLGDSPVSIANSSAVISESHVFMTCSVSNLHLKLSQWGSDSMEVLKC